MPENTENDEPEVEMADEVEETEEGVMVEETPDEEPVDEPEPVVEEEPAPKPKRPVRRKKAVEPAVEPVVQEEEPEAPAEDAEEESTGDEPSGDFAAVLERLSAIEALLTGSADTGDEPVVDADSVARAEKAERDLLAFKIGTRYELPEELIEVLKGNDEETIEGHAKKLSGVSGSGRGSLGKGGLDPNEDAFDAKGFIKDLRKKQHGGL